MLCLKKRRTYSFTQGVCADHPRRAKKDANRYEGSLNMAITTLPRKNRSREERPSRMVLTVTEDTPADMLAGSMELLVQLPRDHHLHTQKVTVQRSTPMMDLLVQIATAHKLAASSYTLQAIGERGLVLPHQPNTPIGALDALQVKLLPKQGTFVPRKTKQANQPFETTFRLQVHLPRNQLYVSRVSPKMNLGEILDEVCREKNLDRNKYELRHPANLEETLDLSLSLQDYHLQEVTLYAKQGRTLGSALSTQDIMALQRQEERRRQQAKQGVFGFMFKKSKEGSLSTDSLGGRSTSPARSDETGRSASPLQPPARPQRKRRPAPKPPIQNPVAEENGADSGKDKVVISHSRNSSDSSGYHEASVLSDNPDSAGRLPETLPRRNRAPGAMETPRKLAQTSQSSKSLGNLATVSGTLSHGISSTSLSSTGLRKKRAAPPPPVTRPLSSAISTQALERIVDSEESLTSDMDPSKPPSDIGAPSKASSDIEERPKASSDIGVSTISPTSSQPIDSKLKLTEQDTGLETSTPPDLDNHSRPGPVETKVAKPESPSTVADAPNVEPVRVNSKRAEGPAPLPMPRKASSSAVPPKAPKRRLAPLSSPRRALSSEPAGNPAQKHDESSETRMVGRANSERSERPTESTYDGNTDDDVFLTPDPPSTHSERELSTDSIKPEDKSKAEDKEIVGCSTDNHVEALESPSRKDVEVSGSTEKEPCLKSNTKQDKTSCTVISTVPKCEHLEAIAMRKNGRHKGDNLVGNTSALEHFGDGVQNRDCGLVPTTVEAERKMIEESNREKHRVKVFRSTSKSNDFETNSLERQKRHLTSHAGDIACALNLNLSSTIDFSVLPGDVGNLEMRRGNASPESHSESVDEGKSRLSGLTSACCDINQHGSSGINDMESGPSETDILLQKVSDTLSNSLPVPSNDEVPTSIPMEPVVPAVPEQTERKVSPKASDSVIARNPVLEEESPRQVQQEVLDGVTLNSSSTNNVTLSSQQDTSDYVSAVDEDLSIPDWEYQLPAPPSAFRDTASPVFDDYDTITLGSVEAFKEPIAEIVDDIDANRDYAECERNIMQEATKKEQVVDDEKEVLSQKEDDEKREAMLEEKPVRQAKRPDLSLELKKEVICELENKIGSGTLNRESESRRIVDNASTPKVAPVDNTLSNFTITTYTRQKSLNIFDEVDHRQNSSSAKAFDDRFINSFPTLSRGRANHENSEAGEKVSNLSIGTLQNKRGTLKAEYTSLNDVELRRPEPKTHESLHRWQSAASNNEKVTVQRSRSYLSASENAKQETREGTDIKCEDNTNSERSDGMKKCTSITNLNASAPKGNEKFSQWRDNILKRQEEPTKEKQLQSLQVLKSILPQLKNTQQADENVSKESSSAVLPERARSEAGSNEHSTESNVVSTRESQASSDQKRQQAELRKSEDNATKRYTYSGPPAISLGSWSERPNLNVQIKMDTDYKLGGASKITNGRTIVSINGTRDERDTVDSWTKPEKTYERLASNQQEAKTEQVSSDRKGPDELTKKLITHTTASGFKKPSLNKGTVMDPRQTKTVEKPIVTGVELKKTFAEKTETVKRNENIIDTSPVNFKELSKAFGQDVCLRPKPKRLNPNRRSEQYDSQSESIRKLDSNITQNGHVNCDTINGQVPASDSAKPKRFTSIVGISQTQNGGQTANFPFRSGISATKNNLPMPVVKGFKIPTSSTHANASESEKPQNVPAEAKSGPQPPRPPTMPVITGVTLKSASTRPKSMPVQIDPRDILLESIRNFGGRGNLKSAAERC